MKTRLISFVPAFLGFKFIAGTRKAELQWYSAQHPH
jgi:hypothetical protein